MIEICALASGSNGNCYYIGNHEEAILVDAGINCKQIFARMTQVGLDPKSYVLFLLPTNTATMSVACGCWARNSISPLTSPKGPSNRSTKLTSPMQPGLSRPTSRYKLETLPCTRY